MLDVADGFYRMPNERMIWDARPSISLITAEERSTGTSIMSRDYSNAYFLHRSPPALYTLLEINKFYPEIIHSGQCEVYIDGGIRRGTDVVKALCLGAKGVGMGRPFMYALTYGEEGVRHAIDSESRSHSDWGVY